MSKIQKAAIAEDVDSFKELEEEIHNLPSIQQDLVSENMDAASFTDGDTEVLAVQPPPFDNEIVAKLFETEDVSYHNDDMQSKLKMNLCIASAETTFDKLSRPCSVCNF